jgi:hypothetical protein
MTTLSYTVYDYATSGHTDLWSIYMHCIYSTYTFIYSIHTFIYNICIYLQLK